MCIILVCDGAALKLINNARSIQLYRVQSSSQDYTQSYTKYRAYECIAHSRRHQPNTQRIHLTDGYISDSEQNEMERHQITMKFTNEKRTRIGKASERENGKEEKKYISREEHTYRENEHYWRKHNNHAIKPGRISVRDNCE